MRYVVTGRIIPERADIRFSPIEWRIPGQGTVVAHCDASQLTIVLDLASVDGWATAFQQAKHFAFMLVGSLGFALGASTGVELIQVMQEGGSPHVIGAEALGKVAAQTLRVDGPDAVFNRAIQLANQDVHFRLAMRDYLRAIEDAVDCALYCQRAIDTLKRSVASRLDAGTTDADHALGIAPESFDKTLAPYVEPVQQGAWANPPPTDMDARWQMLTLTRDVLLKYLDRAASTTG